MPAATRRPWVYLRASSQFSRQDAKRAKKAIQVLSLGALGVLARMGFGKRMTPCRPRARRNCSGHLFRGIYRGRIPESPVLSPRCQVRQESHSGPLPWRAWRLGENQVWQAHDAVPANPVLRAGRARRNCSGHLFRGIYRSRIPESRVLSPRRQVRQESRSGPLPWRAWRLGENQVWSNAGKPLAPLMARPALAFSGNSPTIRAQ